MDNQPTTATTTTPQVWHGTRRAFFAKYPQASYSDYMAARAGRRTADRATCVAGLAARAERIETQPGEIAARFAELQ